LKADSFQGDKVLKELGSFWNISTSEIPGGIRIVKTSNGHMDGDFVYDFEDCPDLALTFIVLCAATGLSSKFFGLGSLKIKESNRLRAIQEELNKVGVELHISQDEKSAFLESPLLATPAFPLEFNTHHDHRIAMSLAILPLAAPLEVIFRDSDVIEKSFPAFWNELTKAGFKISQ
jgi:3-phosphoshikimate 1-carboxyvinyltransferase